MVGDLLNGPFWLIQFCFLFLGREQAGIEGQNGGRIIINFKVIVPQFIFFKCIRIISHLSNKVVISTLINLIDL